MSDPRWETIYRNPLDAPLPTIPPRSVPLVRDPQCPANCSGKHETEALLGCRRCRSELYRVVAHEWAHQEGHYFYTREPIHEAPPGLLNCPACRTPLQRVVR